MMKLRSQLALRAMVCVCLLMKSLQEQRQFRQTHASAHTPRKPTTLKLDVLDGLVYQQECLHTLQLHT